MYNTTTRSVVLSLFAFAVVMSATGLSQTIGLLSNVYAHTFTPNDSAFFLALIYRE